LTRRIHEHDGKFYAWNEEDLEWQEITAPRVTDEADGVRRNVAGNPNTPVEVLIKLSTDENKDVRSSVAWNRNTPVEVLIKLASDENEDVRSSVAGNPNTPVEVLIKLSNDADTKVVSALVGNPRTPDHLLDEPEFNLLQTLIDAESRGSGLATTLREIYVNFDSVQASKNHEKIKSSLFLAFSKQ